MSNTIEQAELSEDDFMEAVAKIQPQDAWLTPVGAAILAALHFGVANDSRSFARILGIEHAIVLREVTANSNDSGVIAITARNERTQRTAYTLTPAGEAVLHRALAA